MEVPLRECLLTLEEASHLRNTLINQHAKISLKSAILLLSVVHLCETIELGIVML